MWHLNMSLKESVDLNLMFHEEEDERKDDAQKSHQTPKRYLQLVSLLQNKMVSVQLLL